MHACSQLARQYNGNTDGYILVYDVSRTDSLDCLITMKKEIDKMRDKKEVWSNITGSEIQLYQFFNVIFVSSRDFILLWVIISVNQKVTRHSSSIKHFSGVSKRSYVISR